VKNGWPPPPPPAPPRGGGGGQERKKTGDPMKKTRVRPKGAPAEVKATEKFPGLQLDSFPNPRPGASFHVKQDESPRGRDARAVTAAMQKTNQAVAKILLDTVVTLCEDYILDRAEWEQELTLLAELADGTE